MNTTTTLRYQNEGKFRETACPSHSGIKILKRCQGQNCFVCKGCQQDRKGNGSLLHLRLPWIEQRNDPVEHAVCSSHSHHIAWSAPQVRYKQNSPHHLPAPVHIWGNYKNVTWTKLTVPPCPENSILFTPAKEPRPCRSAGWGGHKARAGHLKSPSTKSALSSPQFPDSQGDNRWEHPPFSPGNKFSVIEQLRLQQSRVYMCKHAHTMLVSKYSQMQMTSRFSLIIVFSSPWFSCGGGLRTIGDLGGWRGAKDNCGLGIFTSWTTRLFFSFSIFFSPVLLSDPVFWLAGVCKSLI